MSNVVTVSNNPIVLKNRGFKVKLHVLRESEPGSGKYERVMDEESEFQYQEMWFKFTNATLAELEDVEPAGFGSLENWQEAFQTVPFKTLARTFALVFEKYRIDQRGDTVPDWKYGALLMLDGEIASYVTTMSAALQLAQGGNPEAVGESLRKAIKNAQDQIDAAVADGLGTLTSPSSGSPSQPGSPDGRSSDETSTSSGD